MLHYRITDYQLHTAEAAAHEIKHERGLDLLGPGRADPHHQNLAPPACIGFLNHSGQRGLDPVLWFGEGRELGPGPQERDLGC